MNNHEDDTESIVSLESESEGEIETKPIKLKKPIETKEKAEIQYTKTGRVKKPMTEAQGKALAKARIRAREVRKKMSNLKKDEKAIKKDALMMRRLEVEAKLLEHAEKKKELLVRAGYITKKDANLKKKDRAPHGTKDRLEIEEEENQIKELEEQLNRDKEEEVVVKKKKKKVITPISSPEESEEENEIIPPTPPPKIKRSSIQKPIMETKPKRAEQMNPMARQTVKKTMDPELMASMRSLFPGWTPP